MGQIVALCKARENVPTGATGDTMTPDHYARYKACLRIEATQMEIREQRARR